MFVSMTRASTGDQPIDNATMVAEEMHGWLREIEGYHGFVMLFREGTSIGLTFWASRDVAEEHRAARMQFIDRMLSVAGVHVEDISGYDVAFADVGPLSAPAR